MNRIETRRSRRIAYGEPGQTVLKSTELTKGLQTLLLYKILVELIEVWTIIGKDVLQDDRKKKFTFYYEVPGLDM